MPYQPLYRWRRTRIDENDPPDDNDWSGYDGEVCIGRIQKQLHGPMKGKWMWNLLATHVRVRIMPQSGFIDEGREAMRRVEERYHDLMRAKEMGEGLRPDDRRSPQGLVRARLSVIELAAEHFDPRGDLVDVLDHGVELPTD